MYKLFVMKEATPASTYEGRVVVNLFILKGVLNLFVFPLH